MLTFSRGIIFMVFQTKLLQVDLWSIKHWQIVSDNLFIVLPFISLFLRLMFSQLRSRGAVLV